MWPSESTSRAKEERNIVTRNETDVPMTDMSVQTPIGFWRGSVGVGLTLILIRLPVIVLLYLTIIFTHIEWWQKRQETFQTIVFWQQALTAFVGLLVAFMIRDCAWMVQGAVASSWAFRKDGMSLPVSEAIQLGYPSLIFLTPSGWLDKGMVIFVPVLCALLTVVYKFGITVQENVTPWNGIVRTNLLMSYLDQRPVVLDQCDDEYASCKSKYLEEFFGIKAAVPDLDDFSFMDGVQIGHMSSPTGYRLEVGDVPSINPDFRTRVRGGISYSQVFLKSSIDCGRKAANKWTLNCSSIVGPERLPAVVRDQSPEHVQNFELCAPYKNSQLRGVITFFDDSLDLSCLFNISVVIRNVVASTDRFSWKVNPEGPDIPIGNDVLWANRVGFTYWIPRSLAGMVDSNAGILCFASGAVCKGMSKNFELDMASRLITLLNGWVYQFLQWNRNPAPLDEARLIPFRGRMLMNDSSGWLIAAAVKVKHQCHPLEPVGGLVWTLRKVAPDVAKDVHGLNLVELLDYTAGLTLTTRTSPLIIFNILSTDMPSGAGEMDPGTRKPTSFWSSSFGVSFSLVIIRLPIILLLYATIIFTHVEWWKTNQIKLGSAVFWQQVLTAIVGLLVAFLIRDCAWMLQGALAAAWAFRKSGMSLPVSEAIQFGYPMLIFKTSSGWVDKGMVLFIPILCAVLTVVYKFAITVQESVTPWNGIMRMSMIDWALDQRPVVLASCSDAYAACKSKYLNERFGTKSNVPDLDDFSYADGVEVGKSISSTAYRLHVGDVPQINSDFRASVRGGVTYSQIFLKSNIDCGRKAAEPWALNCSSVIGPDRLPTGNATSTSVQNFTLCSPYENSQIRGVVTFLESSLDVSCLFNISVVLRNVSATTDRFSWKVVALGPEVPIGDSVLWANRIGLTYWVPRSLGEFISANGGTPCYAWGAVCKGKSKAYELELGSRVINQLNGWIFQFLQQDKNPMPLDEERMIPFPGRQYLKYPSEWVEVMGPVSLLNTTAGVDSQFIVGAFGSAVVLKNTFVTVEYWVFAFSALIIIQMMAAAVKVHYQCHPLEPVGGLVWTLRKVAPEVAQDLHGLTLMELLNYTASLKLVRENGDLVSIKKKGETEDLSTTKRAAVRSSTLGFEPGAPVSKVPGNNRLSLIGFPMISGDVARQSTSAASFQSGDHNKTESVTSDTLPRVKFDIQKCDEPAQNGNQSMDNGCTSNKSSLQLDIESAFVVSGGGVQLVPPERVQSRQ
ncbi:hypothetical protein HDU67_008304 [Dinochytrium kinnereticum]|nr:hypothetical protein HDU67_008304 [Dinochytrium kinnereticum]